MFDNILKFRETYDTNEDQVKALGDVIQFVSPRLDGLREAYRLVDHFGSVKNVIEANPEQLKNFATDKVSQMITLILPLVHLWQSTTNEALDMIKNAMEAENYCKSLLCGLRNEELWIICLNPLCKVIGKFRISEGSNSECTVYPRKIAEIALNCNANAVIMTHNHPGGTCAPSSQDISSTLEVKRLMNMLSITLLDHIVVANDYTYSMIQHGDIDYRKGRYL